MPIHGLQVQVQRWVRDPVSKSRVGSENKSKKGVPVQRICEV
jgi:hypothetical protein